MMIEFGILLYMTAVIANQYSANSICSLRCDARWWKRWDSELDSCQLLAREGKTCSSVQSSNMFRAII